jgi:alginate O-acetyltransferase complex protein AlgI
MLFNSFTFILFFLSVLIIFNLLGKRLRILFLTFSSYLFYSFWDWRFTLLLLSSTVVDYFIGKMIYYSENKINKKRLLAFSIIFNMGVLCTFKYLNFFIQNLEFLASKLGLQLGYVELNIMLPVGISFYTFQTMSYTIDIYRGNLKPTDDFIKFALFVSYFPQLVAGPIERARNILPQLSRSLGTSYKNINPAIILITTGYFKKVIIGDNCGKFVDHIFGNIGYYNAPELVFALLLFSLQIYADFSGYSNIARGISLMFGVKLMKNFNQPYLSSSIKEFWQRWHISLSTWLRDYLYIPLGGNRVENWKIYRNLFITMLLGGLWHGAGWNFIIWGLLHGLYLSVNKIFLIKKKSISIYQIRNSFKIIFNIISTYMLVLFTWLFFRIDTLGDIQLFLYKLVKWESSEFSQRIIIILLFYHSISFTIDLIEKKTNSHLYLLYIKNKEIRLGIISGILLVCLLLMFQVKPNPFIYFQF